jgi:hypothetical protein
MGLRRSNPPVGPSLLPRSHLTRSHLAVSHFKFAGPQSSSRTLSNDSGSSRVHLLSDGVLHTCCCADGSNPRGYSQGRKAEQRIALAVCRTRKRASACTVVTLARPSLIAAERIFSTFSGERGFGAGREGTVNGQDKSSKRTEAEACT